MSNGSREDFEVAGFFVFSPIRMMGYFRLGNLRVKECLAGSELPAGAINTRKETVKIRRFFIFRLDKNKLDTFFG